MPQPNIGQLQSQNPLVNNDLPIITVDHGGTGLTTIAAGSILYTSALDTIAALVPGTNGDVLTIVAGVPSYITPTVGIAGSGTLNFIPKFTPDGVTLGNSVIYDDGINIGFGSTSPLARIYVKGVDTTNANKAFQTVDSTGAMLFGIRNDGTCAFGGTYDSSTVLTIYPVSPLNTGIFINMGAVTGGHGIEVDSATNSIPAYFVNSSVGGIALKVNQGSTNLHGNLGVNGAASATSAILMTNAVSNNTCVEIYNNNTSGTQFIFYLSSTVAGTQSTTGIYLEVSGGTINYAIKLIAGKVFMGNLQTGNAGLSSGDLYVDTAANILANTDLILARKT